MMTSEPMTAATCMGMFLGLIAMTTSTAAIVRQAIVAFVLSKGFFTTLANSGM